VVLLEFSMAPLTKGESVSTRMRIDYRAGPGGRLKSKVDSVQQKLGRRLST
jgi:uncharacterized protein YqgV (UPF0045/DUF77 family)